jgi:tRNA pseudouridine38/39 synthase
MMDVTLGYEKWTQAQLIARIQELESQIPKQITPSSAPSSAAIPAPAAEEQARIPYRKPPKQPPKPFDASKYSTRLIALKFAYLGQGYNGFEHHIGNKTPLPTVEEELWKALVKTRLISPVPTEGTNERGKGYERMGKDIEQKWEREGADVNWEGCEYSKCGRTDRGVSAFGQVIGVRVRSNKPLPRSSTPSSEPADPIAAETDPSIPEQELPLPEVEAEVVEERGWDEKDELPYIQLLNRVLPPDIRVYAWCPKPPPNFSARFSCKERRYRYFFTNPAFAPVSGSSSLYTTSREGVGEPKRMREGWIDISAMREGCKRLEGLHDFRNMCKIDASKQLTNFKRRIFYADIEEVSPLSLPTFLLHPALQSSTSAQETEIPKMYSFTLHGSAFLWHQVRSIVAILFLIGQGLESPSLITHLLDIEANPKRPKYEMASDAPLVLWDCIFPSPEEVESSEVREKGYQDRLEWIYVGDPGAIEPKSSRAGVTIGRGKWGRGGVIDDVWEMWRGHKMNETLSGLLLDTIAANGKSTLDAEGIEGQEGDGGLKNGPRVFDGADVGRAKGKYVPVLQRERQDPVEVVNERYAKRKGLKAEQMQPKEEDADE